MNNKIAKEKKGKLVSKNIIPKKVRKGLIAGAVGASLVLTSMPTGIINNSLVVEAKKKNTKPKIKFKGKLKNNKKLVISEGDKILVKATAKDKEDGNLTKKIKYNISAPANGIYQKEGKYIKFISDGKYKITVSVKDKKKAKTSLTRTIIVKDKEGSNDYSEISTIIETPTPAPTQIPSRPLNPTSSPKTTSTPVPTSVPTPTPAPVPISTSTPIPTNVPNDVFNPDVVKFDAKELVIDGNTYNVTSKKITNSNFLNDASTNMPTIKIEKDYGRLYFDEDSNYFSNDGYLKYLGKITAKDYKGNDISSNIVITTFDKYDENGNLKTELLVDSSIYIYVQDEEGNSNTMEFYIMKKHYSNYDKQTIKHFPQDYLDIIAIDPYIIFGQGKAVVPELQKSKVLALKNEDK